MLMRSLSGLISDRLSILTGGLSPVLLLTLVLLSSIAAISPASANTTPRWGRSAFLVFEPGAIALDSEQRDTLAKSLAWRPSSNCVDQEVFVLSIRVSSAEGSPSQRLKLGQARAAYLRELLNAIGVLPSKGDVDIRPAGSHPPTADVEVLGWYGCGR